VRDAFTAALPDTHHLRERLATDPEDRLDFYELRHSAPATCSTSWRSSRG
jgi:hypothetical protein